MPSQWVLVLSWYAKSKTVSDIAGMWEVKLELLPWRKGHCPELGVYGAKESVCESLGFDPIPPDRSHSNYYGVTSFGVLWRTFWGAYKPESGENSGVVLNRETTSL